MGAIKTETKKAEQKPPASPFWGGKWTTLIISSVLLLSTICVCIIYIQWVQIKPQREVASETKSAQTYFVSQEKVIDNRINRLSHPIVKSIASQFIDKADKLPENYDLTNYQGNTMLPKCFYLDKDLDQKTLDYIWKYLPQLSDFNDQFIVEVEHYKANTPREKNDWTLFQGQFQQPSSVPEGRYGTPVQLKLVVSRIADNFILYLKGVILPGKDSNLNVPMEIFFAKETLAVDSVKGLSVENAFEGNKNIDSMVEDLCTGLIYRYNNAANFKSLMVKREYNEPSPMNIYKKEISEKVYNYLIKKYPGLLSISAKASNPSYCQKIAASDLERGEVTMQIISDMDLVKHNMAKVTLRWTALDGLPIQLLRTDGRNETLTNEISNCSRYITLGSIIVPNLSGKYLDKDILSNYSDLLRIKTKGTENVNQIGYIFSQEPSPRNELVPGKNIDLVVGEYTPHNSDEKNLIEFVNRCVKLSPGLRLDGEIKEVIKNRNHKPTQSSEAIFQLYWAEYSINLKIIANYYSVKDIKFEHQVDFEDTTEDNAKETGRLQICDIIQAQIPIKRI